LSYHKVLERLERSKRFARSAWLYPYWYFWTSLVGKSGREYWEMDSLLAVRANKIGELINNPNIQPPTKIGLLSVLER